MELSEIYNALETAEGLELEDVFYSDFLGTDDVHVLYGLKVVDGRTVYQELLNQGINSVTKQEIEDVIADDIGGIEIGEFIQENLIDNIDFSKSADELGLEGKQKD